MGHRRRWNQMPGRLANELNGASGYMSAGGTILTLIGFGGFTLGSSILAAATGGVGALIAIAAVGVATKRAIPPKLRNQDDCVGQILSLSELENVYPPLVKLAIIGPSRAGKSTLVNLIRSQPPPNQVTDGIYAYVAALQTNPVQYVAILDAGGHMFAQQFSVAAPADILCIVIDHNSSHTEAVMDDERLEEHVTFQKQVRGYLESQNKFRKSWIHIILNKHDLWSHDVNGPVLTNFLTLQANDWRGGNWAKKITSQPHSNLAANDVSTFLRQIASFLEEQK